MREIMMSECSELLINNEYIVSQPFSRSCFDIIAKKKNSKFLIKILKNIDSLSVKQSSALLKISNLLNATPLLIGSRTRNYPMEEGVVYERHSIKSITYNTFEQYLKGAPPMVYAGRGGFFVNIDGTELRRIREELNISVGELADFANVSRKTIYKYEQNMANPSVEVAIKIEEYLDSPLINCMELSASNLKENPKNTEDTKNKNDAKINKTNEENEFKSLVMNILNELGFNLTETEKAPFDVVAEKYKVKQKYEEEPRYNPLLLTNIEENDNAEIRKKAMIVNQISNILNSYSLMILENSSNDMGNIKTLSFKELEKMDDAFDLMDYLLDSNKNKK
ncbi:helix-turn-helix domain protein [Methanococcus aeolicus Nankai-3]|uniref:Putative HTH-type transcriptional regulatory protein Maeo_0277 n=1 Tax=Methanococcus aeolicus (strain ATCC BAA-1280 / DSM 17508 / OCM 812 / Nankai-3) TaxID=419665 RepID=A6UTP4_META3|nr:transcriptional regulator [Methanococcus aeolicus]ABR55866.1 helix-turn-helix domain protein [Methanococcus aeolicus Nankai-3]